MSKAVFFDNDGVLVDTEPLYFRATSKVFAGKGITLSKEMYVEFFLRQGKSAWFLLKESGCTTTEVEQLRRERNYIYENLLQRETVLINGVEAALRRLHGKVLWELSRVRGGTISRLFIARPASCPIFNFV